MSRNAQGNRGNLGGEAVEATKERRRQKKPPLFASDEEAARHDGERHRDERDEADTEAVGDAGGSTLPHVLELIVPLSVCIGGVVAATIYGIRWLLTLSCIIASITVIIYFINSRRRAMLSAMTDAEAIEEKVSDYRRDLMKTLEGYDVDRGMTQSEIDELVEEYRHHLEVQNASLASVGILSVIGSLFRRNKADDGEGGGKKRGRRARKQEKPRTGRGGLAGE